MSRPEDAADSMELRPPCKPRRRNLPTTARAESQRPASTRYRRCTRPQRFTRHQARAVHLGPSPAPRRSHVNPLSRPLTSYFAHIPAIPCLGEAAHARISGLACELAGPRARRGALAASAPRRTAPLKLSAHTRPRVRPHAGHVGYSYPHDETTAFNVDFPAPAS